MTGDRPPSGLGRRVLGRRILITGAARGIGAEVARQAAAAGARLALVGLEPELLRAVAAELPGDHLWAEADVTDQRALDSAVRAAVDRFGGLDVVVTNAGIAPEGLVAGTPVDALVRTVEVNLIGTVRTVKATLPAVQASRGHLLLISSAAAFTMTPGMAAYGASKAGVEQFANGLRMELAPDGVTVGTAHPIWIDTDMTRDLLDDLPSFRSLVAGMPGFLGRVVPVADCAAAIVAGITSRRRRIYVPRQVALLQAARTITLGPLGQAVLRRGLREVSGRLAGELAGLGRSFGRSTPAAATTRPTAATDARGADPRG